MFSSALSWCFSLIPLLTRHFPLTLWQINTSSTRVLFLDLTLGAACFSKTLQLTLLSISCHHCYPVAPFNTRAVKKNQSHLSAWEIRCAKRSLSGHCGLIWMLRQDGKTRKGFKVKHPYCNIYCYLLHMGGLHTCTLTHGRHLCYVCVLWVIRLSLAVHYSAFSQLESLYKTGCGTCGNCDPPSAVACMVPLSPRGVMLQ